VLVEDRLNALCELLSLHRGHGLASACAAFHRGASTSMDCRQLPELN
jgi:hypothetical protein